MTKRLKHKPYIDQRASWPDKGQIILAQYDDDSVVVYQAYRRGIAIYAVDHQALGGSDFSFDRMSWVNPNFLFMMRRSEWATDPDQKHVLALWLKRDGFDSILAQAVPSRFEGNGFDSKEAWQAALDASEVIAQWDAGYTPANKKSPLRAVQFGLRGETLRQFATEWIIQIEDITPFVTEQASFLPEEEMLFTPAERSYPVKDQAVARRLGLDKSS
jgi:hypothetical protein